MCSVCSVAGIGLKVEVLKAVNTMSTGKLSSSVWKDHSAFIFNVKQSKQSSSARRCGYVMLVRMIEVASQ